jgi:class 3 adenylate cyclase
MGLHGKFIQLIDLAEAQLLLGRVDDACRLYEEATKQKLESYVPVVNARQQLLFLRDAGFRVPEAALETLKPPAIVVSTGYMIDAPHLPVELFPPELEEPVKQAIHAQLDEINATIGYSSAACGTDLIFIEALLRRGGEVNIILPFAIEDFIQTNVRHAGPRWEKRFGRALRNARTVSIAAEERYLGHDMLFRFANTIMHGTAVMRGQFLTSDPHLIAVWDSTIRSIPGGPSDFIDGWTNIKTLHLIDLVDLRPTRTLSTEAEEKLDNIKALACYTRQYDPLVSHAPDRVIKMMMFSDMHGYSKLQDEHIPAFLDFLRELQVAMSEIDLPLESVNTWGDAVFAVGDTASVIAEFGLRYCDIVETLGKKYPEFPFPIRARISLHAGPVYEAEDPFIQKKNYYGGHINRAARLEPVTTVGQVYATQQFVSIFHTEQNALRYEFAQKGLRFQERYVTEHVGVVTLAKSYGDQEVYHLRRK